MDDILYSLVYPTTIYSRTQVLEKQVPIPKRPGVYAWFFKEIPPTVLIINCIKHGDLTLLYIGISPSKPPMNGKPPSKQTLQSRIRYHFQGNAEGSTLRMTLGCLLSNKLGIELRRVGSGHRMTFTRDGEKKLSDWMNTNAFVSWVEHPQPWVLEDEAINSLSLPLNLRDNGTHSFWSTLSKQRSDMKRRAKELPILPY